jgi:hypothetical protein
MMNIGQAAQASGISAKMIRYCEGIGLISKAGRTDAGYRKYSETAVRTLQFIKFTLPSLQSLEQVTGSRTTSRVTFSSLRVCVPLVVKSRLVINRFNE